MILEGTSPSKNGAKASGSKMVYQPFYHFLLVKLYCQSCVIFMKQHYIDHSILNMELKYTLSLSKIFVAIFASFKLHKHATSNKDVTLVITVMLKAAKSILRH